MSHNHAGHSHGGHAGHHHPQVSGMRLLFTILLNISITVVQVIGGLMSGSLALLADALHNFSDVIALLVSYVAVRMAARPASQARTYGYKRAEMLAALFNGAVLIAIAISLCIEAIGRFGEPHPIDSNIVIWLAAYSIIANGVSVLILQRDAKNSLNMRSAYLHLFSDMLTSIAVLAGGIAISLWQVYWLDTLLSVLISIYLIYMSVGLLRETIAVVMQFAPSEVDLAAIERDMLAVPGVSDLHHVHVWQITERETHFQGHVGFEQDLPLSEVTAIIEQLRQLLAEQHHIDHATLQAEFGSDHSQETVLQRC